jgi:Myc proto-oncogene protein
MEFGDPLAHGSVLLDLPFDPDFPSLSDDELGWMSNPGSPEDLLSPDLFKDFPHDQVVLSRSLDKSDALSWDSILHGIQEMPSKTPKSLIGGVMWDGSDTEDMGPPPLRSFFGVVPPMTKDEINFHAFIAEDGLSSDDEILVADGELMPKRRKMAPAPSSQIQAKKAKLAAIRQLPANIAADTPEGKRHTHNVLERKRREDLKISYQNLRLQVPELASAERAPTGQILIKASEYIMKLKAEEQELLASIAAARAQNANLNRLRHGVAS